MCTHTYTHNTHTHTVNSHVLSMAAEGWPKSSHPSVCVSSAITCEYSSLSVPWVTATILSACNTSSCGHHQHITLNHMASSSTRVTLNHTADDDSTCHAQPQGFIINTSRSTTWLYHQHLSCWTTWLHHQHVSLNHTALSWIHHVHPHSLTINTPHSTTQLHINTSCWTTRLYHQHVGFNHIALLSIHHVQPQLQHDALNHTASSSTRHVQSHGFIINTSHSTT